jgi:hypothetical protein
MILNDLTGDAARELARRELQNGRYAKAQPSLATRLVKRLLAQVSRLFDSAAAATPGGRAGLVVVLLVLAGLAVLIVVRLRVVSGGRGREAVFATGSVRTAAEHRSRAEEFAAEASFGEAVRERFRAIVRELEVRGVLDPRPGRTAAEVADDAGRLVPAVQAALTRAATTFDEVWYGGRSADATAYRVVVEVDEIVATTRLVLA